MEFCAAHCIVWIAVVRPQRSSMMADNLLLLPGADLHTHSVSLVWRSTRLASNAADMHLLWIVMLISTENLQNGYSNTFFISVPPSEPICHVIKLSRGARIFILLFNRRATPKKSICINWFFLSICCAFIDYASHANASIDSKQFSIV